MSVYKERAHSKDCEENANNSKYQDEDRSKYIPFRLGEVNTTAVDTTILDSGEAIALVRQVRRHLEKGRAGDGARVSGHSRSEHDCGRRCDRTRRLGGVSRGRRRYGRYAGGEHDSREVWWTEIKLRGRVWLEILTPQVRGPAKTKRYQGLFAGASDVLAQLTTRTDAYIGPPLFAEWSVDGAEEVDNCI